MIYVTGDTHGEIGRFLDNNMGDRGWCADDTLIVCGDFGFVFGGGRREIEALDYLETKSYTVCFCDGNHENFHRLDSYPVEEWNGGRVHRIRKNVLHLMRGQVFDIGTTSVFTMGGAYSIDRYMREEGVSFWREEIPSDEDYRTATESLSARGNAVDIIITHTAPAEIIRRMGAFPDAHDAELTGFLEWIMYSVKYKHWYFGHWHRDTSIDTRFTAVHYDVHAAGAGVSW